VSKTRSEKLERVFVFSRRKYRYVEHAVSDKLLLAVFVPITLIGLLGGILCTYFAFKSARKSDGELGMAFWSLGALAGFTVSGMTLAYFVIPILWLHLTSG
jgi:hypothetical protein